MAETAKTEKRGVCKACGGTGLNSKGGPCVPCIYNRAEYDRVMLGVEHSKPIVIKQPEKSLGADLYDIS